MATCKECLHYEMCYIIEGNPWEGDVDGVENDCAGFKDKTECVEQTNEHKCTKSENGYSFYVRCTCGAELNVDIYYWNAFKLCPNCGAKMDGD